MLEIQEKVLQTIEKNEMIKNGDKIVVGVSGGPDSICLLDILRKIKEDKIYDIEIFVAHINHMLRENAKIDEKYVEDYCEKYNIQCFVKRAEIKEIASLEKRGLEETGRKIRYDFFEEIMQKNNANKIAIAHNCNDNAETIIMNVFRGSGITGLKGIEPKREDKYIRPIIECNRQEIEDYCAKNNIIPRIDESNFENEYTRNKIRNICIPYIKENFNPNIIKTLNRLSETIREEEAYMQSKTEEAYKNIFITKTDNEITLDLKQFNNLEKVIKRRIVIYTINKLQGNSLGLQKINIEDIVKMCEKNIGNKYLIPSKNIKVLIKNKKIIFMINKLEI